MLHLLRQSQCPHEVSQIVGQGVKLEPNLVVADDPPQYWVEGEPVGIVVRHGSLGQLERDVAAMADHFGADLDQP